MRRIEKLYWVAFVFCCCYYFGFCAFPVTPVGGDGTSMASGALQIIQQGWDGPRVDYGRETRPLIFWTLIALRWLTGADTYLLFSLLALVAGITCVVFAALLAARFLRVPAPLCGIAILVLFPPASAMGCVPEGNVVAGALGMIWMYLLARSEKPHAGRLAFTGVLAGLSTLARLDAVLLGFVSIPLLYSANRREMLKRLTIFGGVAAAVCLAGLCASGYSIVWIMDYTYQVLSKPSRPAQSLMMKVATRDNLRAWPLFFPLLTLFLIMLGAFRLFRRRQWKVLWIVAAGLAPLFVLYGTHMYVRPLFYTIPFFALFCISALEGIPSANRRAKFLLGSMAGALFVVQYLLGVNIVVPAKPWYPCARPTLIALGETEICSEPVIIAKLGIGAGGPLVIQDGWRYYSGLMFHPLAQHLDKRLRDKAFRAMKDHLAAHRNDLPGLLVYTSQFGACTLVNKALQDLGYSCCERSSAETVDKFNVRYVWKYEDHIITHVCADDVLDPWNRPVLFAKGPTRDHILYVAAQGAERAAVENAGRVTKVIFDLAPEVMCVLEVRLSVEQR